MRSDLDQIILQFLVVEGYQTAALNFAKEIDWPCPSSFASINQRRDIRAAIFQGNIPLAIEKINDLVPEVRTRSTSQTV